MSTIEDRIRTEIEGHPVVLFMKGTPQFPMCGFSSRAVQALKAAGAAQLQVSFFWPVRASYIVFALDDDYQHALVSGPTHDYLWLLSRTPQIRPSVRATLLEQARAAGFDTGRLLWVDQRRNTAGLRGDLPRRKLPR